MALEYLVIWSELIRTHMNDVKACSIAFFMHVLFGIIDLFLKMRWVIQEIHLRFHVFFTNGNCGRVYRRNSWPINTLKYAVIALKLDVTQNAHNQCHIWIWIRVLCLNDNLILAHICWGDVTDVHIITMFIIVGYGV